MNPADIKSASGKINDLDNEAFLAAVKKLGFQDFFKLLEAAVQCCMSENSTEADVEGARWSTRARIAALRLYVQGQSVSSKGLSIQRSARILSAHSFRQLAAA